MKKLMLTLCFISLMLVGTSFAQDDTTTNTNESSVFFFYTPCETEAVFDLNGFATRGVDVYLQVFDQAGGTGNPLTDLIRVSVDGDYEVSQVLPYNDGKTLLLGQFSSAVISLASESDASDIILSFTNDEILGTCNEPSFPLADSSGATTTSAGSTTPLVDPVTGSIIATGEVISTTGIFTPDGGRLNDVFSEPQEAIVQIGARPSDINDQLYDGRVSDPGLIFAECDAFPGTEPGIVWDTDNVTVFWSWYASTPELAQDHINNARYEVFLSSPYAHRQVFPNVIVSPITLREDGNYYVFYSANLGDGFRSGQYRVDYYVTWNTIVDDGYALFGPNTQTPFILNTCTFNVEENPFGIVTEQNNPTVPLQQ